MNGKKNGKRYNGTKKNLTHEESQDTSQIAFAELNEKFNKLMNSFNKLEENNKQLNGKYSTIVEDNEKLKEGNKQLNDKYSTIVGDNEKLKEGNKQLNDKYSTIVEDNEKLKKDNEKLKDVQKKLEYKMKIVEKRIDDLESLVMRNNINIDLIANRESLKTILLMFSVNLGITTKEEIKQVSKELKYGGKFTELILNVLRKLNSNLNPIIIPRAGFEKENKPLNNEEKNKIKKQFIFVECIHFIVCTIDNIVHPPEEKDNNEFSKIKGNRSQKLLERCLIQFFENPKTIDELNAIFKKIKDKQANNQEVKEQKEDENNIKDSGEEQNMLDETKNKLEVIMEDVGKEQIKNITINDRKGKEIVDNSEIVENKKKKEDNENIINATKKPEEVAKDVLSLKNSNQEKNATTNHIKGKELVSNDQIRDDKKKMDNEDENKISVKSGEIKKDERTREINGQGVNNSEQEKNIAKNDILGRKLDYINQIEENKNKKENENSNNITDKPEKVKKEETN